MVRVFFTSVTYIMLLHCFIYFLDPQRGLKEVAERKKQGIFDENEPRVVRNLQ
jgi:hypothetical protein